MSPDPSSFLQTAGAENLPRRHAFASRALWHTVGLIAALAIGWLLWKGYRQPEMLLEFANMRLC